MKHARNLLLFCAWTVLSTGCAATVGKESWVEAPPSPAVEMQEKNIAVLTNYIDLLNTRLAELTEGPEPVDPVLSEIHESDLAGIRVRLELLSLLRNHCQYAKEKLLQAEDDPSQKQQILDEFLKSRRDLMVQLDALDQRQDAQERKRMDLGLKLIENSLQ